MKKNTNTIHLTHHFLHFILFLDALIICPFENSQRTKKKYNPRNCPTTEPRSTVSRRMRRARRTSSSVSTKIFMWQRRSVLGGDFGVLAFFSFAKRLNFRYKSDFGRKSIHDCGKKERFLGFLRGEFPCGLDNIRTYRIIAHNNLIVHYINYTTIIQHRQHYI